MSSARGKLLALLAFSAFLAIALGVAACGGDDNGSKSETTSKKTGEIKVGVALIGPKNDKSFNQAAYEGVQAAIKEDPNLKLTSTLENRETDQQRTDAIETLAPNNDVVVAVSAAFGPILDAEAAKFPKTYFIDIAGYTEKFHKNVTGFANDWGAPAYVGGVIAANLTKSGTVGYVGGAEIPPTVQGANAFVAGAKSADPKVKTLKNIVGDFNDVAKAKSATTAMIDDGADVVFPFLDAGIAGSYAAGKDSGKNPAMYKLTIPDCKSYSNVVGTEVVNNFAATTRLLGEYVDSTLKAGAIFLDLQEPKFQTLALCPKYEQNDKIASVTKETIDGVNSGDIKLPANAINPRPNYPYQEGFSGKTITP